MSAPLVVFDLDGTLVDTAPDLIRSLNHAVTQAGLKAVGYEDLTHLVGHGARAMIERAFAMRGQALDDETLTWQLKEFLDFYCGSMPGESLPYPGVADCLARLADDGFLLAVCTNKPERLARRLLEGLSLSESFVTVTGGDTYPVRKPDAAHLLNTISAAGSTPAMSVMVGDSLNDILVARNARVPSIAVPFGYSDVPVASLDPGTIVTGFDTLTPELVRHIIASGSLAS